MMRGSGERGEKEEMIRKGPWKKEEDQVLIDHVKKYGSRDWSSIRSKGLLQRTGKSCRLRWVNKLNSALKNKVKLSQEEKRKVLKLQAQFGNKWARIAKYFPGRTDNDVKNYFWNRTRKKRKHLLNPSAMKFNGKNTRTLQVRTFGHGKDATSSRVEQRSIPPEQQQVVPPNAGPVPPRRKIVVRLNGAIIPPPRGLVDTEGVGIAHDNHVDVGDQPRVSGLTERSSPGRVIVGDAHGIHPTAPRVPKMTSAEPRALPSWPDQSRPADSVISLVPWGRGLHVRPEAVPYLDRIIARHGDIVSGVTINNNTIVSILAEELARLLCLMEQYTCVNIPATHQEFLSKHLKDCTSLGVDVSWLVSRVDSMTAMSKLLKGKEAIEKIEKTIAELTMDLQAWKDDNKEQECILGRDPSFSVEQSLGTGLL